MPGTSEPASTQEDAPSADDDAQPQDDQKQRFREALERKQAKAKSGQGHADGSSKIHETHGPAAAKRQFRRKSG